MCLMTYQLFWSHLGTSVRLIEGKALYTARLPTQANSVAVVATSLSQRGENGFQGRIASYTKA